MLRAVDLLGGKSGAPSDVDETTRVLNWIQFGSSILVALYGDDLPARVRAAYGYEPELGSTTDGARPYRPYGLHDRGEARSRRGHRRHEGRRAA